MQIERRTSCLHEKVMPRCSLSSFHPIYRNCGFIHFLVRKVINRIFIGKNFANFAHYRMRIRWGNRYLLIIKLEMGHHQLDTLDEQILKLIADNARIPFLEVARACNVSGAAIHQRIQKLTNLGILKVRSTSSIRKKSVMRLVPILAFIWKIRNLLTQWQRHLKLFPKLWNVTLRRVNMICLLNFTHAITTICWALSTINYSRWG